MVRKKGKGLEGEFRRGAFVAWTIRCSRGRRLPSASRACPSQESAVQLTFFHVTHGYDLGASRRRRAEPEHYDFGRLLITRLLITRLLN